MQISGREVLGPFSEKGGARRVAVTPGWGEIKGVPLLMADTNTASAIRNHSAARQRMQMKRANGMWESMWG